MPLIPRTRQIIRPGVSGTRRTISTGVVETRTVGGGHSTCTDIIGDYGGNHGLEITHALLSPGTFSGKETGVPFFEYSNYPFANQAAVDSHLTVGDLGIPSTAEAITRVQALTNPSRPELSAMNFIYELKDIPGSLLTRGQQLLKSRNEGAWRSVRRSNSGRESQRSIRHKQGNSVAEWNFQWEQLGRDLRTMINFSAAVDARMDELNEIYNHGGLARRKTLMSRTLVLGPVTDQYFHSSGGTVIGSYTTVTRYKVWASVNWIPNIPGIRSAADLRKKANALVHGWEFSGVGLLSNVWEALPWTWFADWFLNVGDLLAANRNRVEFQPTNPCRMVHIRTTRTCRITAITAGLTAKASSSVYETKSRYTGSASLTLLAPQPFLAAKRLTTLSSIIASKAKLR